MILKDTIFGFMPLEIVEGLENSNNHRLLVIYNSNNGLQFEELANLECNYYLKKKAIEQDFFKEEGNDFAIMNCDGKIIYQSSKSSIKAKHSDDDDYVYINDGEFLVYSHRRGYTYGRSKEEIYIKYARKMHLLKKDEPFTIELGFTNESKKQKL